MLYVLRKGQGVPLERSEASVEVFKNNKLLETVHIRSHGTSLTKSIWNVLSFEGKSLAPDLDGFDHFRYEVINSIQHREPPKSAFS